MKILLIEDNAPIRQLYKATLETGGFEVVEAEDGEVGFLEAQKGGYDLILLDIMLPKKDGVAFVKEYAMIKPQNPNGKIVMLTNVGEETTIKECLTHGAAGYLLKPQIDLATLAKEIQFYLPQPS